MDSYECWRHLLQDVRRKQGKEPVSRELFDAAWGQGPEADQSMFFPGWTLSQVLQYYDSTFLRYAQWVRAEPEAQYVLKTLRQEGRQIAVVSNSTSKIVEGLLRQTSLYPYVDVCIGANERIRSKPEPDLILAAMEKMAVGAADVCYIGDSIFDEQAARAASVFFIGYKHSGDLSIQRLEDLLELAGGN